MRIGLLSDSHGNTMAIDKAVEQAGKIDMWLHAGDMIEDAEYLSYITDAKVVNVAGNCDWFNHSAPGEQLIEAAGHRILLTHGHSYDVKRGIGELRHRAEETGADIVVYGHSHVANIQQGEILVINPGSISRPRDGQPQSFMVLKLEGSDQREVYHYHI